MRFFFLFCGLIIFNFSLISQAFIGNIQKNVPVWDTINNPVPVITSRDRFNAINLELSSSKFMRYQDSSVCFCEFSIYKGRPDGYHGPFLKSKDGNFIAIFGLHKLPGDEKLFFLPKVDFPNLKAIRAELAMSFNKHMDNIPEDIEQYIERKSPEYAKKAFNADQVVTYPISLRGTFIMGKYTYCDVLRINKEQSGNFELYYFYTEEGYKDKKKKRYHKEVEKILKFKE